MNDLNLPPNPSAADIEQEILFHHIVLESLDRDISTHSETEAEVKDKIRRLNQLLEQHTEHDQRNDASSASKKRPRVDSISDATDARDPKSHRSSPKDEPGDSSDSDIEYLMSKPINQQSISRGVEQQRRIERTLQLQRQQQRADAELARVMMATQSTPNLGANLVQPTLGRTNSMLGFVPNPHTPSRVQSLALRSPQQTTNPWYNQPPRHSVATSTPLAKPFNFDDVNPRNSSVPHSAQQSSSSTETHTASDSDESLAEIDPADFVVNSRSIERKKHSHAQRMMLQEPVLQYPNTQPNGYVQPPSNSQMNPFPNPYGLPTLQPPLQPMHPANQISAFSSTPAFGSAMNPLRSFSDLTGLADPLATMSHLAYPMGSAPMANAFRGFGDVAGTAIGNIISAFEPAPTPPDPHSYLYSDPTRNAEEIKALLKNIRPDEDLPAELRKGTPPEMATTLLEHQKLGLTWLTRQEEGSNKGGILADDMGLGKTIQAIALMVSRRAEDEFKTNLIIAPVALLGQWQQEIEDKVKSHYKMSIFRYHGVKATWNKMKKYDVVLTTYGTLGSEWKKTNEHEKNKELYPDQRHEPLDLPLTGKDAKWYRYERQRGRHR
jgi:hypothetical protein